MLSTKLSFLLYIYILVSKELQCFHGLNEMPFQSKSLESNPYFCQDEICSETYQTNNNADCIRMTIVFLYFDNVSIETPGKYIIKALLRKQSDAQQTSDAPSQQINVSCYYGKSTVENKSLIYEFPSEFNPIEAHATGSVLDYSKWTINFSLWNSQDSDSASPIGEFSLLVTTFWNELQKSGKSAMDVLFMRTATQMSTLKSILKRAKSSTPSKGPVVGTASVSFELEGHTRESDPITASSTNGSATNDVTGSTRFVDNLVSISNCIHTSHFKSKIINTN